MINVSYEVICIEFERRNNTTLVVLLLNCPHVLKLFLRLTR